jgi:hypothetical protein
MITMALLVGIWSTTCIQTQINKTINHSGYAKESYTIDKDGAFEFKREWFRDSTCQDATDSDIESGTIELGDKLQGLFISSETVEADFSTQSGVDLGAISLNNESLKVARGVRNGSMRNTMLSLFEYAKRK